MSMFVNLLPSAGALPELELTAAEGPLGGPSYSYRGATIDCQEGGNVCALEMPDHLLHERGFNAISVTTSIIDLWLDGQRLPNAMQLVAKGQRRRQ